MNVFILDEDPQVAARMLCDIHLGKMLLEAGQMLSGSGRLMGYADAPYQTNQSQDNHGCTVWARTTHAAWEWLIEHGKEIHREYMRRFQKGHGSLPAVMWADKLTPDPQGFLRPFSRDPLQFYLAVDVETKPGGASHATAAVAVQAYRAYYVKKEQKWIFEARVNAVALAAADREVAARRPLMSWTTPGRRPRWMSPHVLEWKPSENQVKMAKLWVRGRRMFDPMRLTTQERLELASLAGVTDARIIDGVGLT